MRTLIRRVNSGKNVISNKKIGSAIFLLVAVYWIVLGWKLAPGGPFYHPSFIGPMESMNSSMFWKPMDFGSYQRFSPTSFVPVYLLDRYLVAPLSGVSGITDPRFLRASRMRPFFYAGFALLAVGVYALALELGLGAPAAIFAGLYVGFHKGFSYFLQNISTLSVILMLFYALGACFSLLTYVRGGSRTALAAFILLLLLTAGSWEMWMDFCLILIFSGIVVWRLRPELARRIIPAAVVYPGILLGVYFLMRFPAARGEFTGATEAQFFFSYPSVIMMFEEMAANLSLHVMDCFDSAFFPWPTLSFSVFHRINMDSLNTYNAIYTSQPSIIYRAFAVWYAGGFFVAYLAALVYILLKMIRSIGLNNPGRGMKMAVPAIAITAVTLGCAIHLPIMHRTYYLMPGYFMTYSHLFSLLGAAIFLAWTLRKFVLPLDPERALAAAMIASGWVAFCNASKVVLSRGMQFPW